MKNILEMSDLLSLEQNLSVSPKNYIKIGFFALTGIVSISLSVYYKDIDSLSYFLMMLGIAIVSITVLKAIIPSKNIINGDKKVCLCQHKFHFDIQNEALALGYMKEGNINEMKKLKKNSGQLLAIVYTNKNNDHYIAQLFRYIPYDYHPCCEPIVISGQ